MGKKASKMTPPPHPSLDTRVGVIENSLGQMGTAIEHMSKSIDALRDAVSNHRSPVPFKEIVVTAATCLAILTGISSWVDAKIAKELEKPRYQIEAVMSRYELVPKK